MKFANTTYITNNSLLFKVVAATEVTALCKKTNDSWGQNRFWYKLFHRIRTTRQFANASYEPHYGVAERL